MKNTTTATAIIDSITAWSVQYVSDLWERKGITGTEDDFAGAVLNVFEIKLERHLADLDARQPGKADLIRATFAAEYAS